MTARVAICFTGEVRTFERTWKTILDHVIAPNRADVFVHCSRTAYKSPIPFAPDTFERVWGHHVKDVRFWNEDDEREHQLLRDRALSARPGTAAGVFDRTHPANRDYLVRSGTLYEYTEILKCAQLLVAYERAHQFRYDVVIRARLDTVFIDPFEVTSFFESDLADVQDVVRYVQCLGNAKLLRNCRETNGDLAELLRTQVDSSPLELPMVHTLRKNVIWIANRAAFELLYPLIRVYGDYDDGTPYAWDSESQFAQHARRCGLVHIDYHGPLEEHYLVSRAANQHVLEQAGDAWRICRSRVEPELMFTVYRPSEYGFDRD